MSGSIVDSVKNGEYHPAVNVLSEVALSNLFTMGACQDKDPRQRIPLNPVVPPYDVRLTRARLTMKEALETIDALGFYVITSMQLTSDRIAKTDDLEFVEEYIDLVHEPPSFKDIIDGAADSIYVNTGTILSCGVADMPHLRAVCNANEAKFPNGVATLNDNGKYLKPAGWTPPDHTAIAKGLGEYDHEKQESDIGIWFRSGASGGWYTNPRAAGSIDAVRVDGVLHAFFEEPTEDPRRSSEDFIRGAAHCAYSAFQRSVADSEERVTDHGTFDLLPKSVQDAWIECARVILES